MAVDGLALIVNRQNPDSLISVRDIQRILTGEVKTWKDIYHTSRLKNITLVFDNQNSSTVRFAMDSICRGKELSSHIKALHTNQQVIDYVARTPEAIGVIGVNWLENRSDTTNLSFRNEIKVMSVSASNTPALGNSYKPYQAYLFYGDYPLTRNIYVLLNDPRNGLPWGFASFLTSDRGQRIILKSGLVPATQPVRIVNIRE
jgi:phosphate transport system substrate-binding protein